MQPNTAGSPSPPDLESMQLESRRQSSNTSRASPESGAGMQRVPSSGEEGKLVPLSGKEPKRGKKEIRLTDKSCLRCRLRKVRCDRDWPTCKRCRKREEKCEYDEDVTVDDSLVGADDARIRRLESKITTLEQELSIVSSANSTPPSGADDFSDPTPMVLDALPILIHSSIMRDANNEQHSTLFHFFLNSLIGDSNIGPGSLNWRLALPAMATSLTRHLIDASAFSCCFRLPAYQLLKERIPYYKENVQSLNPAAKVAVAILCTLGARSSPHSALLGVAGVDPADQASVASSELMATAGIRRERACRALMDVALNLCYRHRMLHEVSREHLESLVALTQLLSTDEAKPERCRMVVRIALGMFQDLQHDLGPEEAAAFKRATGPTLFENDSNVAAISSRPCLIARVELADYFTSTSVRIPDFSNEDLGSALAPLFTTSSRLSHEDIQRGLETAACWVAACQRVFAIISTGRTSPVEGLKEVRTVWEYVDHVHSAVQRLQQTLVKIDYVPEGLEGDLSAVDHYVLLGVRMDTRLVGLVNLMHRFLLRLGPEELREGERETRWQLVAESELRVRKCLKLHSFYAHLYLSSRDKHLVYHLAVELSLLPNWTTLALQRVGDRGGPPTAEYEVTEQELDWLTQAMRLASFYTPLAVKRVHELVAGRRPIPSPFLEILDSSPAPVPQPFQPSPAPQPYRPSLDYSFDAPPPAKEAYEPLQPSPSYSPSYSPFFPSSQSPLPPPPTPSNPFAPPPTPSTLFPTPFQFNDYGVPSHSSSEEETGAAAAARAYEPFRGQSWMDVSLTEPWADLYVGEGFGGEGEGGEGMERGAFA